MTTQPSPHGFHGVHIFGEMYGISSERLDHLEQLKAALEKGIQASGATLCNMQWKQFEPSGLTLLALLSESHASIHTYPEEGALFFDAFTCGTECKPEKIAEALEEVLKPERSHLQTVLRGEQEAHLPSSPHDGTTNRLSMH